MACKASNSQSDARVSLVAGHTSRSELSHRLSPLLTALISGDKFRVQTVSQAAISGGGALVDLEDVRCDCALGKCSGEEARGQ